MFFVNLTNLFKNPKTFRRNKSHHEIQTFRRNKSHHEI